METQLGRWRRLLATGHARVGWKIGLTAPQAQQRLGLGGPVVGHLTLATTLVPGTAHSLAGGTRVGAEPEVAIHLDRDVPAGSARALAAAAITGLGPALEIIDVDAPFDDLERIVARNVFHRAVAFGPTHPGRAGGSLAGITARALRDGRVVAEASAAAVAGDLPDLVCLVADLLGASGERLLAGDRIISGALTEPVWVKPGETAGVELGEIGALEVAFTA
jgi:2-keto-4-pentenoate hydratase